MDLLSKTVTVQIITGKVSAIIILRIIKFIFLGGIPIYEVKIHCCCKLLRKVAEVFSYSTSSKLSVRPARHHVISGVIKIIITSVIGKNCFHVNLINLSYRIRGYAPRDQINSTLTKVNVMIIIISVTGGMMIREMNRAVVIIPMAMIFIYSAIKIKAKVPDLYSVLKPETSSDSPSARSNGVRLVSAREVITHVTSRGHNIIVNKKEFIFIKQLKLKVEIIIIGVRITKAIDTSYEIVWAILRNAPSNEYLLFEAHPENRVVYTFILDTDRNNIIPYFIGKGVFE